jgi:hypothetical protein
LLSFIPRWIEYWLPLHYKNAVMDFTLFLGVFDNNSFIFCSWRLFMYYVCSDWLLYIGRINIAKMQSCIYWGVFEISNCQFTFCEVLRKLCLLEFNVSMVCLCGSTFFCSSMLKWMWFMWICKPISIVIILLHWIRISDDSACWSRY